MKDKTDTIFLTAHERIANFAFDAQVAAVFPDMISRSVPGYASIINAIGLLAGECVQAATRCYDLGCSLGAATLSIRQNIGHNDCRIISVDNSDAMCAGCQENIAADNSVTPVDIRCENILATPIDNASLVVLNFTLQFVALEQRHALIEKIFSGLNPEGVLVLSEKLAFDNANIQHLQTALHHQFKRANGYSELEISQKRSALENVLIPETLDTHRRRLHSAGFKSCEVWFQCFNFASIVAIK